MIRMQLAAIIESKNVKRLKQHHVSVKKRQSLQLMFVFAVCLSKQPFYWGPTGFTVEKPGRNPSSFASHLDKVVMCFI